MIRKDIAQRRKAKKKLLQPVAIKEQVVHSSVHPDRQEYIQEYETKGVTLEAKKNLVGKVTLDAKTYAEAAGWRFPGDILAKIPWQGTLLCIGKKKNQIIMDAIRTDKPCILACPWSSGTSYSLEILDRIITFPKMISSMVLTRMENVSLHERALDNRF